MSKQQQEIEIECRECDGSGIYRGFAEPQDVGVVCLECGGMGKQTLTYLPFQGRNRRSDVKVVRRSRGRSILTGVGSKPKEVNYEDFLKGIMP